MTIKEKWELDHPGKDSELEVQVNCPDIYYPHIGCDHTCGPERVGTEKCVTCWNREYVEPEPKKIPIRSGRYPWGSTDPHIKDSGDRTEFNSGAVRDMHEGKGRCDLLPIDIVANLYAKGEFALPGYSETIEPVYEILRYIYDFTRTGDIPYLDQVLRRTNIFTDTETMILEVAKHFEEGCKKYGENNWRKGIPAKFYIDSGIRHYLKHLRGDTDEPHDRAFVWNIMCCIWTCAHKPELNDYAKENTDNGREA